MRELVSNLRRGQVTLFRLVGRLGRLEYSRKLKGEGVLGKTTRE